MREIEYRAWYKHTKEMLEVLEIRLKTSPYMHLTLAGKSPIHYFGVDDNCILMEYTGLKDKHGNKVFEGDIVQTTYSFWKEQSKAQVVFEHFTCGIRWLYPKEPSDFGFHPLYIPDEDPEDEGRLYWDLTQFEVIGNIYANPQLLRQEP